MLIKAVFELWKSLSVIINPAEMLKIGRWSYSALTKKTK